MININLDVRKDLQKHLFIRGFLITNSNEDFNLKEYPFYSNWDFVQLNSFKFLTHNQQEIYYVNKDGRIFFIIGHAYNPFTMQYEEEKILEKIAASFSRGSESYFEAINELTGLFLLGYVEDDNVNFLLDTSGFQTGYYGEINNKFYITSHVQILGDLYDLSIDPLVSELINYKWYPRVMGPYLPADLSKYSNIKRIVPNFNYSYLNKIIKFERFYPIKDLSMCSTEAEYTEIIKEAAEILRNNMVLISKKWDKPQISLTGGIDSNTTFAATNDLYERYETFSYVSAEKESPDAEAAEIIASKFNVKHTTYMIPDTPDTLKDYEIISKIIDHNNGNIKYLKENEKRKRVVLMDKCTAELEVKSWGSETIRGYWYKHFNRKKMPKLSGKLFTNLYKIFIGNRTLSHKIEKVYDEYIEKYSYEDAQEIIPAADLFFWEVTWGSWGGSNVSEMRICFDITVPYNNRRFLDLMFKVPLNLRITDQHHKDMKKYLNEKLYDMNIQVTNLHETDFRANSLNTIFTMNMMLPF